jgi:putative membrane protein
LKQLVLVLKGMAYGVTHVAPGLGGGIVLLLMGIYEPFVESVGNLFVQRSNWRRYLAFLIPLGIGMVLGVILAAVAIEALLESYPTESMIFFMGLLLGTVPSVLTLHGDMRPRPGRLAALLLGLALVVGIRAIEPLLVGHTTAYTMTTWPEILYNGAVSFVAGGASVTPGLDGSYILLLGGTYAPVLSAVAALKELTIRWGALLSTVLGAGLGILVFSKLIDLAIKRAPALAYYCVLGLVLGSVYGLWPDQPARLPVWALALCLLAGGAIALLLGRSPQEPAVVEEESPLPERAQGHR